MTESSQHTSKPQVEVEASGGDDNKSARRGAIFIGVVLVGYIVYLVVTGQMGQFWAAMSSVQAPWLVVACLCMFMYLFFGIVAYAIAVWLDPIFARRHPRPDLGRGERHLLWQPDAHDDGLHSCPDLPPDQGGPKRRRGRCHAVHALYRVSVWPRCLGRYPTACSHAVFCRALWRHDAAVRL